MPWLKLKSLAGESATWLSQLSRVGLSIAVQVLAAVNGAPAHENQQSHHYLVGTFILSLVVNTAQADRVKDLTNVGGVRGNQLVGYGLGGPCRYR